MDSYLAYGPEIYLKAHENPRVFSCISVLIFLDSSELKCCNDFFPTADEKSARNFELMDEPIEDAPDRQKRYQTIYSPKGGKKNEVSLLILTCNEKRLPLYSIIFKISTYSI